MVRERWNRIARLVMAGALLATGWPLAQPLLPRHLEAHPGAAPEVAQPLGKIEVDAKDTLTPAQLQTLNARYGLSLAYNSIEGAADKLLVGDVDPGREATVLAQLNRDPLVEDAEPLHTFSLPHDERAAHPAPAAGALRRGKGWTPNDPRFPEQWNMGMIGAEQAWAKKATGKGIVVAVIDTGVASENDTTCYQARDFGATRFVPGYNFVSDTQHPFDDHGHGTHVAGTVAETTNNGEGAAGLAYEASIMPLKVLDNWGGGTSADIADAIRFAADHGAKVINMSLGGPFPDEVMHRACQYAAKKGVLIVCAAGNSGGGPVGYPAAFPECLAVSSVGPTGELAPYSSAGREVGIAAPGGDRSRGEQYGILQNTLLDGERASDDYYAFQGTSMASPHVAATAALIMGRGITDAAQVKQLLQRAAVPKKPSQKYGAGILDAAKSVQLADNTSRDSLLLLLVTVVAGITGMGVGVVRDQARRLARFPWMPLGFMLGLLGPDLIFGWLGFGSPFNLLLHSALIPLYLLWEAESGVVYRFVSVMALGTGLHLAWDAVHGNTPFTGVLPVHAMPWLWVNLAVGLAVALVAWRRSFAAEAAS